jgi:hypothetical protein
LFSCLCYYCRFFIFIFIPIFFFLSILSSLTSPSSHPYSPLTLPPSPVLKSITLLPNYSFFPFSSTLYFYLTSPPILPQPVTRLPLPPTQSQPADQPTIPTLHNSSPPQSLTQAPYTTTTEIHSNTNKGYKTQQPFHCLPYSPTPHPASLFTATLNNSPNFNS